ncbi:MAG: hypothetical protein NZM42_14210, partial [Gemmatales bacterium]|nr:hypothetical protein [Gemmatales bacterium]MDW8224266.1 hypothetical protein [Gemmatales bacterium]
QLKKPFLYQCPLGWLIGGAIIVGLLIIRSSTTDNSNLDNDGITSPLNPRSISVQDQLTVYSSASHAPAPVRLTADATAFWVSPSPCVAEPLQSPTVVVGAQANSESTICGCMAPSTEIDDVK